MKMQAGYERHRSDHITGDNPARIQEKDYTPSDEESARRSLEERLQRAEGPDNVW